MRRLWIFSAVLLLLGSIGFACLRYYTSVAAINRPVHPPHYYTDALKKDVDSIAVVKYLREMSVYHKDTLLKIYRIALGDTPVGHKHFEGDQRTPEGRYMIYDKNPHSTCHKNLGISYPNAADRAYAAKWGRPAGGDIKIHGIVNGKGYIGKLHLLHDWTNGCIAVTDEEIDELYAHVKPGIPVFISP